MNKNKFYTQKEVADIFRCSKGSIIDWGKQGHFDVWRSPQNGRVLYTVESVDRFYEKHLEKGSKKAPKISTMRPFEKPSSHFKVPTNIQLRRRKNGEENKQIKPPSAEDR